jgi:hypothetical protein
MSYESMDDSADFEFGDDNEEVVNGLEGDDLDPSSDELLSMEEIDFAALGIDPLAPTEAKPGSEQKVLMLAARYEAGLPLWHGDDRYDHGPGSKANFSGLKFDA